ncbi:2-hydroxyacyl- lyase 1 [Labeo rohita]|uniref:2-hydroxyacyl-lyase 1 n=2 Tax=Labeo rohita TaxID=84645 RepID=A0A498NNC9_LABRO|nr:2-hydroxyacyl- lyase 1 [Labeo rohita]
MYGVPLMLCIKAGAEPFWGTEATQLQTDLAITATANMLTVLALMTLLMVPVESDLSNEELKSLSNPQSRTLFFRILQSYLEGRESEAQAMNRKTNVKDSKNSNIENTGYDKYDLFLHNDIYDV